MKHVLHSNYNAHIFDEILFPTPIHICVGVGDCLLYCQMYDLYRNTFKYTYVVNKQFILQYKDENYLTSVQDIFTLFNVPLTIIDESINYELMKAPDKILVLLQPCHHGLNRYGTSRFSMFSKENRAHTACT